jgi:hypothetical protein
MAGLLKEITKAVKGFFIYEDQNQLAARPPATRSLAVQPGLTPVAAPRSSGSSLSSAETPMDLEAIYKNSGIPSIPVTVEQVLEIRDEMTQEGLPRDEILRTLPVMVKLKYRDKGTTVEEITTNTSRKISALESFSATISKKKSEIARVTQLEIDALQKQIEAKHSGLFKEAERYQGMINLCQAEAARLREILKLLGFQAPAKSAAGGEKKS